MASSIEALLNPNEIRLNLDAPNLDEELTRFNELYELLLANSRETDLDEAVKVARWKILAGEPARKKLRECQWEPGEKVTIESMTAKLVKGLPTSGTVGSIFVARKAFWRRECKPGEGFSAWLADLGAILTRCSYAKPDEMLRDKIVCFHADNELAAQLVLLDKDVSLDTVIAKCRSHELAHKHQAEQLVSINRVDDLTPKLKDNANKPCPSTSSDKQQSLGLFQKPPSTPKRKPVDAVQQEKPSEAKKNRCSEGWDKQVLRDRSPIRIPATKPVMTNPRNAYAHKCRRQRRQAAAIARNQEAMAVDAEKIELESAVGLKDGAESTPAAAAAVDEEAEGSMLDEGLLTSRASPPDDDEKMTVPISQPQVKIVDISRLLVKDAQKADVGAVDAKTACDITIGASTAAAAAAVDEIDTKVTAEATMNQDTAKVAVDGNVKRKETVDVVQIQNRGRRFKRRKRAVAYSRDRRRKRRELAAILKELEDHPFDLGSLGKRTESTLSDCNGQEKLPDVAEGKTSDGPQQESVLDNNRLQQEKETNMGVEVDAAVDIKIDVDAIVNSDVKVNMPIADADRQKKKVPDGQLLADGSNPVKEEASSTVV